MKPVAIVIGAGGRIGAAIAAHLEARGYAVALGDHGALELADERSIERFFGRFDALELLVNAAGAYGAVGRVRDIAPAAWRQALEVNLLGVYACCHHALARLQPSGHIVNLAGGGRGPMELRSGYAAAKSALWRFTETLAAEEPRLYVNAIAPGPMDSRMQDAVVGFPGEWANCIRKMRADGAGAVPLENTLRALDHILSARPTGELFFARQFAARPRLAARTQ